MGHLDRVESEYRDILSKSGPMTPQEEGLILNNIAYAMALNGKTEEPLELIGKAIDLRGPTGDLIDTRGFIYLVSIAGVTGARQTLPPELESFVKRVRQRAEQPLCVGFGISSPDQARRVAGIADGVIVGSRLLQLVDEDATFSSLGAFVAELREALDSITDKKGGNMSTMS